MLIKLQEELFGERQCLVCFLKLEIRQFLPILELTQAFPVKGFMVNQSWLERKGTYKKRSSSISNSSILDKVRSCNRILSCSARIHFSIVSFKSYSLETYRESYVVVALKMEMKRLPSCQILSLNLQSVSPMKCCHCSQSYYYAGIIFLGPSIDVDNPPWHSSQLVKSRPSFCFQP